MKDFLFTMYVIGILSIILVICMEFNYKYTDNKVYTEIPEKY